MNGFQMHSMKHVSPSTLNVFSSQAALFVLEKLLKRSAPVGAAAHRGTGVEAGVVMGLLDPSASIEACQQHALLAFDKLTALSGDHRRDKERSGIPGMVAVGISELRQYGVPDRVQEKIVRPLPEYGIDILGFSDIAFSHNGCLIDIKTTHKIPAEISESHARQLSHYVEGTNQDGRIAYLSPSRIAVYQLQDQRRHYEALLNITARLERFLSVSPDPQFLASIVCPDTTSFWFSSPITRAAALEVFGL